MQPQGLLEASLQSRLYSPLFHTLGMARAEPVKLAGIEVMAVEDL